jgi:hypothetical protein
MVSVSATSRAWAEVVAHDARFEFPDAIGFADGGPGGSGWHGGPWAAEGRLHRLAVLPRRGGGVRTLAILDPAVHARYRALVARVAGPVERALGHQVDSARCAGLRPGLSIEAWRPAWRRHVRRVRRLAGRHGPAVRLDVRDCFGSLAAEVVVDAIGRAGAGPETIDALGALLDRFRADGIRGLPVGPEPSAVLANIVLGWVDRALGRLGLPFARWCDDVTVGLGGTDPAVAVEAWAAALGSLGLRPAEDKTRFVEAGDPIVASGPRGRAAVRAGRPRTPASSEGALSGRAVAAAEGPDPFVARVLVARLGQTGGREARRALRHIRATSPHLAATVDWGLRR